MSNDFSLDKALSGLVSQPQPKPPQTSRELAEHIHKLYFYSHPEDIIRGTELIDLYVQVKETEARLYQHNRDCEHEIGTYCAEYLQLESRLTAARMELGKMR